MAEQKATLAELNERIKMGPYHQWLGVEVTDLTEDEVVFYILFREEMMVHPERHYTHGGILPPSSTWPRITRSWLGPAWLSQRSIYVSTTTAPPSNAI